MFAPTKSLQLPAQRGGGSGHLRRGSFLGATRGQQEGVPVGTAAGGLGPDSSWLQHQRLEWPPERGVWEHLPSVY